MLIDGFKVKEHDLFIKSNGWSATIDYEPIPKFLKQSEIINNGLSLPNQLLKTIKNSDNPINSSFHCLRAITLKVFYYIKGIYL